MIPKIIHYCWLSGDKYPDKIEYCINTWKKKLHDYQLVLWDLHKFDIDQSEWCKEAYSVKKYAFAADFIRCYALYHYGGIYLDSDVEVVKSFDDLLDLPYFIGKEKCTDLEPAIMGSEKGWLPLKKMLEYYSNRHFIMPDGSFDMKPMPLVMKEITDSFLIYKIINSKEEFVKDVKYLSVFNPEFFSPKVSHVLDVKITENTYSIHHFEASWFPASKKCFRFMSHVFGYKFASKLSYVWKLVRRVIK